MLNIICRLISLHVAITFILWIALIFHSNLPLETADIRKSYVLSFGLNTQFQSSSSRCDSGLVSQHRLSIGELCVSNIYISMLR